ncbi:MAG: OmpA family protein [Sphingobacteriales bacterium]|nr:OmpA family protein [Sphingobacteriales bacterium]
MKRLFILTLLLLFIWGINAQIIDPGRAARRAAENRVNRQIDRGINKGMDKAEEGIENAIKKDKNSSSEKGSTNKSKKNGGDRNQNDEDVVEKSNGGSNTPSFSSYGKFDFVPGEKVIAFEDFSQDALGDFPAKWNTNGSGELVKLNNYSSKFLKTLKQTVFYPEFIKSLPENFTVEFDLSSTPEFSFYNGFLIVGFTNEPNVGIKWSLFNKFGRKSDTKNTLEVGFHPTGAGGNRGMTLLESFGHGNQILDSEDEQSAFVTKGSKTNVHVSIWRQKSRIRVYIDEQKIWDIPRAFPDGSKVNSLYFRNNGSEKEDQAFFISNLRVAVGAPDTRNKLITEGKFVTTGILFDVNSDKIKPSSYGVLKDIANVLTENEDIKVKIVGHTDSDGDDASNLALSKKRAESVKKALSSQFGISEKMITTDGMGESQPVSLNTTPEGKANNRRVEFIKQ